MDHDPAWTTRFADIAATLTRILGPTLMSVEHVGSTAVPGIAAKPIIDVLLVVRSLEALDDAAPRLEPAGWQARGEFGIAGRRFFVLDAPTRHESAPPDGARLAHLHAFTPLTADAQRHRDLRDYLIAHPAAAAQYSDLKRELARRHPDDIIAYMDGKHDLVRTLLSRAADWRRSVVRSFSIDRPIPTRIEEPAVSEVETVHSDTDGLALQLRHWPVANPRAACVLAHGMGEHALRYEEFALALNSRGIDVWAPDHRGHGASPGPEGHGDFGAGGWNALVADLSQILDLVRDRSNGAPVILFGHSMGSMAAQQYACGHDESLHALILSGTTCFDALVPTEDDAAVGLESFNAPFEPGRTGFEWLSRDPEQVDRYVADPWCGFDADPAALGGMLEAAVQIATPDGTSGLRSDLPVLVMAGDADPLNQGGALIERLVERWRSAGVRHIDQTLYSEGRHEMLNETNREQVIADLLDWIDARLR